MNTDITPNCDVRKPYKERGINVPPELITMVSQGASYTTVANRFGFTRSKVAGMIRRSLKAGIIKSSPMERLLGHARIAQWMADNGGTPEQCAADLGITLSHAAFAFQAIRRKLGAQAQ